MSAKRKEFVYFRREESRECLLITPVCQAKNRQLNLNLYIDLGQELTSFITLQFCIGLRVCGVVFFGTNCTVCFHPFVRSFLFILTSLRKVFGSSLIYGH